MKKNNTSKPNKPVLGFVMIDWYEFKLSHFINEKRLSQLLDTDKQPCSCPKITEKKHCHDFFNEQLEIVDIYTLELSEIAKDFGQAMVDKNYKTEEEAENAIKNGELSENELDLYYKFGIISNDYKIQRSKLLDFVYFCNILNIEIDISNIKNTKGLLEFSKEYLSYKNI